MSGDTVDEASWARVGDGVFLVVRRVPRAESAVQHLNGVVVPVVVAWRQAGVSPRCLRACLRFLDINSVFDCHVFAPLMDATFSSTQRQRWYPFPRVKSVVFVCLILYLLCCAVHMAPVCHFGGNFTVLPIDSMLICFVFAANFFL